jgi:hypothetical protein
LITLPEGIPELTLGWEAIHWASKYLRQPDGPEAGQRWEFIESQVRFVLWWYSLDENGRWIYYHGVRRWAKGAGKSPFAAVMSLIELLAPVRLDHFDDRVVGGAVGRKVSMPLVQIGATSHDQANVNTMRMVRALLPKNSRILRDYDVTAGMTIFHIPGGGQLMVITSSPTTEEGALTTFAILDQTESFTTTNGGVDLAEVMDRNVGKSGSRIIETSNAWEPGLETVAERTFDAWVDQEEGKLKGKAKILYDARCAPPDIDWDDIASIRKAIEFTYGDCFWADPDNILDRILSPKTPLDVSKRFYLNWPESAQNAWTTHQKWSRLAKPDFYIEDGSDIAVGFDGSRKDDATALLGCHIETGFTFSLGIWEPRGTGREIPVEEVLAAVEQAKSRFHICAFFADVKEWEETTKILWRKLFTDDYELDIWAVPGGRDPQPVAWDMRSHVGEFTQACEMVESEIDSRGFSHDGDGVVGRHVVNARRAPNKWGVSISKEAPKSERKIDGCVSMIIARHARRLVLASKGYRERKEAERSSGKSRIWSFS